jgi:hypothetical protein
VKHLQDLLLGLLLLELVSLTLLEGAREAVDADQRGQVEEAETKPAIGVTLVSWMQSVKQVDPRENKGHKYGPLAVTNNA